MKHLNINSVVIFVVTAVILPIQANATNGATVPEPLSLALLATGVAGLGTAEVIRRRRKK